MVLARCGSHKIYNVMWLARVLESGNTVKNNNNLGPLKIVAHKSGPYSSLGAQISVRIFNKHSITRVRVQPVPEQSDTSLKCVDKP